MPPYGSRSPDIQAAFEHAYDEHATTVYAVALRIVADSAEAQDIVQDVFLRLWRDWDRYDERRGAVGAYLRVMARSMALDAWREHGVAASCQRLADAFGDRFSPAVSTAPSRA